MQDSLAYGRSVTATLLLVASACVPPPPAAEPDGGPFVDRSDVPDDRPLRGLTLREVRQDPMQLDFVVKSKIYAEDPNTLFLTQRGGGVSTFDVSVPLDPQPLGGWVSEEDVEGQDRRGDVLVVVARAGRLLTFDVSDPATLAPLGELVLESNPDLLEELTNELFTEVGSGPFGALHTKLYDAPGGRLVALVTATATGELLAVDVSDPARPTHIGAVDTGVAFIEGIFVHRDHAFVGGFGSSDVYKAVEVADPEAMRVVASLDDIAFRQMVSEMKPYHPDILYAALWNDPGGLGTFDVQSPERFRVLDRLLRPELTHSNRVKVLDNIAFLPLEQEPGGLAAVDVSDPQRLRLIGLATGLPSVTKPYTLEVNGSALYLFGTDEASMAVFEIDRGEPRPQFARWSFDDEASIAELASGLDASDGVGRLTFMDAERGEDEPSSSAAQTRFGTTEGIGHLTVAPEGAWEGTNGLVMEHGLDENFAGRALRYTLVWDLMIPAVAFGPNGCFSGALALCATTALFQLDRRNNDDAELFVKVGATPTGANGFIGEGGGGDAAPGLGGYGEGLSPDTWHRVAAVVDFASTDPSVVLYVDGQQVWSSAGTSADRYTRLVADDVADLQWAPNSLLLFADDTGEVEAEVRLASLLIVNRAYSAEEIEALGPVDAEGIPVP